MTSFVAFILLQQDRLALKPSKSVALSKKCTITGN
jgi:hypothetical protein